MKRMLLLLHCLLPGGAINAAITLAEKLQQMGYQLEAASCMDGPAREGFASLGIPVVICENMLEGQFLADVQAGYDELFVNTLLMHGIVSELNRRNVKVHWWIHEPPMYFQALGEKVAQEFWDGLGSHVSVYAAGEFVHEWILESYGYHSLTLNFGIEDIAKDVECGRVEGISPDKATFLIPSMVIQYVKGQDLMVQAIRRLPKEYMERSEYLFLGDGWMDEGFYRAVTDMAKGNGSIRFYPAFDRQKTLGLMKQVDCIVAPSREDATNACIVEGMMLSKPCLCSDRTGISKYMHDCVDGFVFASGNADDLCARIMLVIDNIGKLEAIARNGRNVFEKQFSMEVFEDNVKRYWQG